MVSDAFISLLTSVKSFTCGSCSRSFRKYNNYFISKQALVHILIIIAIVAFANPSLINPANWLMTEQASEANQQVVSKSTETMVQPVDLTTQSYEALSSSESLGGDTTATANNTSYAEMQATGNGTNSTTAVIQLPANATMASNSTGSLNGTTYKVNTFVNGTDMNFNATAIADIQNSTLAVPSKASFKAAIQSGRLNSIYFKDIGRKTRINLDLGGSPLSYTSFFLRNPDRLVVDIHGSWEYFGPTTLKPENPIFSKFRIGIYENKLRMVMDLKGDTPAPSITKTDTGLNIDVK
ncbi:AMIN domain-containing protein [Maridesulfovibrio frigidus]|uniref:AMIN domain-containing protein n=1 Tax=Maridesulfovibrio frigidus TaxID=340956 RepID=UPI001F25AD2C|nr:AMIN domain-containing protein [Maridesulfovibrio frigidus]